MTREERHKIIENLTGLKLTVVGCMEEEAIVTSGGVSVKEIDSRTMESKLISGLYFAGEVIDVDGYTADTTCRRLFRPDTWRGKVQLCLRRR